MNNVPFAAQLEELAAYMASKISVPTIGIGGGYAPVGTTSLILGSTAPQDYLECDGSVYNIAAYPQLAAYIESQFGSKNYFGGNGTTTFGVPTITSSVTGTIYCIKAVVAGEVYSTEERVVGTWVSGEKIYQKTIVISDAFTVAANAETDKSLMSGINELVDYTGFYTINSIDFMIPAFGMSNSGVATLSVCPRVANTELILAFIRYGAALTVSKMNVTIRYTKTT